jgi:hypothetical protein
MVDRQFTEVDLRRMLEHMAKLRDDIVEGRWVAEARHNGKHWEVIVEPDFESQRLVVVTAYPLGS